MMLSNMSNREHFKLHGSLPAEVIEDLIEVAERADEASDIEAHLSEASAQYPGEDFLADVIRRLQIMVKHTRGDNRDEIESLVEDLDEIQTDTTNSADYGRDELKKAQTALDTINF